MLSSSGFRDGLGERDLFFDRESGEIRERLFPRPEFAAYESALRRRIGRLASIADPRLVSVRGVEHDRATGRLTVISDHISGMRLSDALRAARERELIPDLTIGLFLAAEILAATHTFHSLSGLPHGCLHPDRVIVSAEGEVVVADYAYAEVIEASNFAPARLWREFGIAHWLGEPFSFAADVRQAALVAIALMLGRPVDAGNSVEGADALLVEVEEAAMIRGGRLFAEPVIGWLTRATGAGSAGGFSTSDAAADSCALLLTDRERALARPALVQFLVDLETPLPSEVDFAFTEVEPLPEPEPSFEPEPVREPEATLEPEPAPAVMTEEPAPEPIAQPEPLVLAREEPVEPVEPFEPAPPPDRPAAVAAAESASVAWARNPLPEIAVETGPRVVSPSPLAPFDQGAGAAQATPPPEVPRPPIAWPPPVPSLPAAMLPPSPFAPITQEADSFPRSAAVSPQSPMVEPAAGGGAGPVMSPAAPVTIRLKNAPPAKKSAPARAEFTDRPASIFERPAEEPERGFRLPWKAVAAAVVVLVAGVAATQMKWSGTSPAAAVAPGILVIESTPPGSDVFIDGEKKGETPAVLQVPPGRHAVKLTRKGTEHTWSVDVASGARRVERLDWTALVQTGGIEVISNTPGSKVFVDGKLRGETGGETPLVLTDLPPGRHLVVVQGPNGNVRRRVTVIAGETTKLDLAIYSGWVIVSAPIELQIFEKGKQIGTAGEGPLVLSAGAHTIELVNESLAYRSSHGVDIAPGEEERLAVTPKGLINVNAIPWAEVWVDDERLGETPLANVSVTLGSRELVFKHPEYGERRVPVTVTGGAAQQVSVDLTKPSSP
ncbi:MAG: PEGA domain-containing protein [Acidobacteria bacterium]|nr:PEGA domain-containing protein [Acidobacteriota bacterium]